MKKIIKPAEREISETICDNCGKPAVSFLKFDGGYGSSWDLYGFNLDLCEHCGVLLLKTLETNYPSRKLEEL